MSRGVPVRNVIFDFGGVLVNWQPEAIISGFYAEPALRDAIRRHAFQHDDWLEMDRGTLDEPTVALLTELHEKGYRLYGLSNMSASIFAYLKSLHSFFDLFHGIVVSAFVKSVKPEPAIYEHLRSRFALDFGESVFIDDLARNVESARALGLPAIRFESTAQVRRELEPLLALENA